MRDISWLWASLMASVEDIVLHEQLFSILVNLADMEYASIKIKDHLTGDDIGRPNRTV